jgi:hypothetical protein
MASSLPMAKWQCHINHKLVVESCPGTVPAPRQSALRLQPGESPCHVALKAVAATKTESVEFEPPGVISAA